jgi:hypothetical protein
MRATKHVAPQPWRAHGLVMGIPMALLDVGGSAAQPDVAQATGVRCARP